MGGGVETGGMDIVFLGSGAFGLPSLEALAVSGEPLFPVRRLRFIGLRAGLLGLLALAALLVLPVLLARQAAAVAADEFAGIPDLSAKQSPAVSSELPADVLDQARRLFPDDSRLATLAARAIADGDTKALEYLLGEAGSPQDQGQKATDPNLPSSQSPAAPAPSTNAQAGQNPANPGEGNQPKSDESKDGGKPGQDKQSGGSGPPRQKGTNNRSTSKGGQLSGGKSEQAQGDDQGDPDGSGASWGGKDPGEGLASELYRSNGQRIKTGADLLIDKNPQSAQFELVVQGKGIKAPLSQVLPAARTSATSGFNQNPPPLQYEAFVRSYFRALSQEARQ